MKFLLIKTYNPDTKEPGSVSIVETDTPGMDFYEEHLKCSITDSCIREVNGVPYKILLDDGGTFVKDPVPSAFYNDSSNTIALWGNLLVTTADRSGDLTEEDICNIRSNIVEVGVSSDESCIQTNCLILDIY